MAELPSSRRAPSGLPNTYENDLTTQQTYDANNQLTGQSWQIGDTSYSQTFTYNKVTGNLTSMTPGNGHTIRLEYDALQRLNKVDTGSLDRYYTYRDISNTQTTSQVTELRYGTDTETFFTYTYTYDSLGNIATYSDGTNTYTYTYDGKNQLISQTGGPFDFAYTYDSAGNITWVTKSIAATILSYTDPVWTDRLTEIHEAPITYDASGNPTSYCSNKRWKMEWEEGRNLVRAEHYSGTQITCAYDQNGLRLSKDVNGVKHEYLYASGTLLREVITGTDNAVQTLDFFYDQSGRPYALNYTAGGTTTTYYYITNLQGDVLHLITADGTVTASYTYNPYGTVLTSTGNMAAVNPLRYRGYYYDSETSFYYLQSRYYDPEIGRFINADSYISTGQGFLGHNMYAYCRNNPVLRRDSNGFTDKEANEAIEGLKQLLDKYTTISEQGFVISIESETTQWDKHIKMMGIQNAYDFMSDYLCQKYEETYEKEFLFSNECVSYEIEYHVDAYMCMMGYSGYWRNITTFALKKEYLIDHCKTVDISTSDVTNASQRFLFGYFDGIRKCYRETESDPFAVKFTFLGSTFYIRLGAM